MCIRDRNRTAPQRVATIPLVHPAAVAAETRAGLAAARAAKPTTAVLKKAVPRVPRRASRVASKVAAQPLPEPEAEADRRAAPARTPNYSLKTVSYTHLAARPAGRCSPTLAPTCCQAGAPELDRFREPDSHRSGEASSGCNSAASVSYTHLDVYKRQCFY